MNEIQTYFPDLKPEKIDKLYTLQKLQKEWNQRINLVSRKDIDQLNERHILHSLSLARYYHFAPGTRIIDVGTGGGFPGIPLAIYFDQVQFTLVDSIGKKIKAVDQMIRSLDLNNVTAIHSRAEKITETYDFIVSRAVTQYPAFIQMFSHLVKENGPGEPENGILYYKGGDLKSQLGRFYNKVQIIELGRDFDIPFFSTKCLIYLPYSKMSH